MRSTPTQLPTTLLLLSISLFSLPTNTLYLRPLPHAPNTKVPRAAVLDWDDVPNLKREPLPAPIPQPAQANTPVLSYPVDMSKRVAEPSEGYLANRAADSSKSSPGAYQQEISKRDDSAKELNGDLDERPESKRDASSLSSESATEEAPKIRRDVESDTKSDAKSDIVSSSPAKPNAIAVTSPIFHTAAEALVPLSMPKRSPPSAPNPSSGLTDRDTSPSQTLTDQTLASQTVAQGAETQQFAQSAEDQHLGQGAENQKPAQSAADQPLTERSLLARDLLPQAEANPAIARAIQFRINAEAAHAFETQAREARAEAAAVAEREAAKAKAGWKTERVRREEARAGTRAAILEREAGERAEAQRMEKAVRMISERNALVGNDAEWERNLSIEGGEEGREGEKEGRRGEENVREGKEGKEEGQDRGGVQVGREKDGEKEEKEDPLMGSEETWRKDLLKRLALLEGRGSGDE